MPGAGLLLQQAQDAARRQIEAFEGFRAKSRGYLTAGAISITIASGFVRLDNDAGTGVVFMLVLALIAFLTMAAIAAFLDFSKGLQFAPSRPEFTALVDGRVYSEDALAVWLAKEYDDLVLPANEPILAMLARLSDLQLIAYLVEVGLSVVALIVVISN